MDGRMVTGAATRMSVRNDAHSGGPARHLSHDAAHQRATTATSSAAAGLVCGSPLHYPRCAALGTEACA
jgi:hypothetical protein